MNIKQCDMMSRMSDRDIVKKAVREAARLAGSQAKLAAAIDTSPQEVSGWISDDAVRKRPIPVERAIHMEKLYSIQVERFSPTTIWTRIPDADWPHPKGRPVVDPFKPRTRTSKKGVRKAVKVI